MTSALQANFLLFYVAKPLESAAFYTRILGRGPVEVSPGFALFALDSGLKLGLWARAGVEPAVEGLPQHASGELAFALPDIAAVQAAHQAWLALGLSMLQAPTQMDFGYTFTAADPDGHRLRVFCPQ
ncbi:catechol 2,3-dioxygenase-like lactoylglutathione lyase family enzyme [Paucibacter oligotrophus]|uniref:Catechol 2,3-dioxygenase-like lactoylglutathione lyase family enzyme n=1 Tax=Roseateles oligotrophus TaxID=1769250 RepID=A0A840L531_9BURK|nr:VOC family protein [Roseateles oligotrophus]MBB4841782.1 catechol 2,3-dioxygenase-like lactoylglutathione lyase family enzyme [Roseateles oligotrophus]